MTNQPPNHELDDELLSAYIDGELTDNERAAVEARLATDPAAQKLLHELRSVSQSVQAMPTVGLGRDLSQEILRRASKSAAAPSANVAEPTTLIDTMPKIRAFGSTRSWLWASLALAAGLLIMFVQRGDETKNLPPIAARDREAAEIKTADGVADSSGPLPAPATAPASPPPASIAATDRYSQDNHLGELASPQSGPTGTKGFASGGQKLTEPALGLPIDAPASVVGESTTKPDQPAPASPADSALASSDKSMPDKFSRSANPEGRLSGAAGAPGSVTGAPARQYKAEITSDSSSAQQFTVVRLVARPAALQNGSFERLLANHQIEFVSPPAEEKSRASGGELAKPAPAADELKLKAAQRAESLADRSELVLVEAPGQAIESFLADLNKNATDFPSIAVSEESSKLLADVKDISPEQPAEFHSNLSRFNRGTVPHTNGAPPTDNATNESIARRLRLSAPSPPNLRHARARAEQGAQRQLDAATTARTPTPQTQSAAETEQTSTRHQTVLFVIIPESPAPSGPPPDDPSK